MKEVVVENYKLERRAGILAISVATILILSKLSVWLITDSLTILSSLIDSSLDFITSTVNLIAIYYATKPADENHRFGYNSMEDIAGLLQCGFICGSGFFIILEVVNNYIHQEFLIFDGLCIGLMIFSITINLFLTTHQKRVIKKTNSTIIKAERLHYKTDLFMNLLILTSFVVIYYYEIYYLDFIGALIIAVYIIMSAFGIGKNSFNNLMDKEISTREKNKIKKILDQEKQLLGYKNLKTRKRGGKIFLQFHAQFKKGISLVDAHKITLNLEEQIKTSFRKIEVIIEQDPK